MASIRSTLSLPLDESGDGKVINRYFDDLEESVPLESASAYAAVNAVQTITKDVLISAGNYTITVNLQNGRSFTTANILYSANAATIQTAINTAGSGIVTSGHIVVTGGNIATADVVLTFSGATVSGTNHPVASVTNVSLVGGTVSAVTRTTIGHPVCPTLQIVGTQGPINFVTLADPTTWTRNRNVKAPSKSVQQWIGHAAVTELQDQTAYAAVLALFA